MATSGMPQAYAASPVAANAGEGEGAAILTQNKFDQ